MSNDEQRLGNIASRSVRTRPGWGDRVASVAKPIARLLGMDPECEPCAERQQALNEFGDQAGQAVSNVRQRISLRRR